MICLQYFSGAEICLCRSYDILLPTKRINARGVECLLWVVQGPPAAMGEDAVGERGLSLPLNSL